MEKGEQLNTLFFPQKIFVCLETEASRQEGLGWNQMFSSPQPFHVVYWSCSSKLCPESPRIRIAAVANPAAAQDTVLRRALAWPHSSAGARLSEPPTAFPSLGDHISHPPDSRDNSASYGRANTKEIAGTKKDRGQNFIGFGVLFAVTQEGCRRKSRIKLS